MASGISDYALSHGDYWMKRYWFKWWPVAYPATPGKRIYTAPEVSRALAVPDGNRVYVVPDKAIG